MSLKDRYFWLTPILGIALSMIWLGDVWLAPDQFLFSHIDDGLQTYYQSIYHVQNDTSLLHQDGLNYPYGESIFFTGGQPVLSNTLKALNLQSAGVMVALTNYAMLISFILCPLFLYLILTAFKVPRLQSMLLAIGITFLSQQLERMTGHYPLGYVYAVPGMLWFLMRYHEHFSWKWTWIISAYVLFLISCHLYFLVFLGAIAFGFWMMMVLLNKSRHGQLLRSGLQLVVQVVLPFVIMQLSVNVSSGAFDRTAIPWGFEVFRSTWASYFFPYNIWYESWFDALRPRIPTEWEGLAYIGGAAIILIPVVLVVSVFRFRTMYLAKPSAQNRQLLSMVAATVFCIAFSFTFPFNYGHEELLHKLGALQQFRGPGRFALVAFYMINIIVVVLFFRIPFRQTWLRNGIFVLLLALMYSEGYNRIVPLAKRISNERQGLLSGQQDALSAKLEASGCQAILPLPFFHIGSENVWFVGKLEMTGHVFDLSLKMKTPILGAMMSRTSLGQTYKSIGLCLEMMELPGVLQDLPDRRPFLIVCDTNAVRPAERQLIRRAQHIADDGGYSYFLLPLDVFDRVLSDNRAMASELCQQSNYAAGDGFTSPDASVRVLASDTLPEVVFSGKMQRFYEDSVPAAWRGKTVKVSMWIDNFCTDLIPRTLMQIGQFRGSEAVGNKVGTLGKEIVGLKDGRALVEYTTVIDPQAETITLGFENKLITGKSIHATSLLIRPDSSSCCILRDDKFWVNNRTY